MRDVRIIVLGFYLSVIFLLLVYFLVELWPRIVVGTDNQEQWVKSVSFPFFSSELPMPDEARIFLLVILSGALGGMIHALQSFAGFVGSRTFVHSWLWWYILRPAVGAGLAVFFYLALRGGLFAASTVPTDLSVFGFSAIGALAGLFSEQATAKLKELFDTLFKTQDKRPDKLTGEDGGAG